MKKIIFSTTFLFLISQFVHAQALKIKSDPVGAEIFVRELNSETKIKIGNTPFEGSLQDIFSNNIKSNFFFLVIKKENYEEQVILMSDLAKSDVEMNLMLKPKEDFVQYVKIDKVFNDIFEAQRLIRSYQFDQAIIILKAAEEQQSKLSIIPEMIGNSYYLKKDPQAALVWFEKAYRLNPENKDAFTMKMYLRKALGINDEKK